MLTSTLLAVAARSTDWTPFIGVVMIACNILAIVIAKFSIQQPNIGPSIMSESNLLGGFSLGAVVGTICLGHILGAGVILGLSNLGVL